MTMLGRSERKRNPNSRSFISAPKYKKGKAYDRLHRSPSPSPECREDKIRVSFTAKGKPVSFCAASGSMRRKKNWQPKTSRRKVTIGNSKKRDKTLIQPGAGKHRHKRAGPATSIHTMHRKVELGPTPYKRGKRTIGEY